MSRSLFVVLMSFLLVGPSHALLPPPALEQPVVRACVCPDDFVLEPGRDALLVLPDDRICGGFTLRGGRNIRVVGGHVRLDDPGRSRTIELRGQTGTVFLEGLFVDVDRHPADGIAIFRAPRAHLVVQNARLENMSGEPDGLHGDVIHAQGAIARLTVERLTGRTGYQGLFLPWRPNDNQGRGHGPRELVLTHVDLAYAAWFDPRDHVPPLLWLYSDLADGTSRRNEPRPTQLSEVYLSGGSVRGMLRPATPTEGLAGVGAGGELRFAAWTRIEGEVTLGRPPGGPFVPATAVGHGYRSPHDGLSCATLD
jgi:hypothetical protein